jgi:O-antigen ligase
MVLGLPLLYPFLQCLPLPASWMAQLNPHLMQWKKLAGSITLVSSGSASISYEPLVSFFSGLWWVFLVGYALLFRKAVREETSLNWLFTLLFWVAGSEALYGLLQTLIPSLGVLWESAGQGVARGTFVNRNHYAAFLGMLWPLLLAYQFCLGLPSSDNRRVASLKLEQQKENQQKRWFLGFVIGLMLLALVFSQSRGGIMAALLSLTVFVGFGKKYRRKGMVAVLLGSWVVMLLFGSIIGFEGVLTRFNQLDMDSSERVKIWGDTMRLIGDHWLTGTGLGTYPEVIRVYQSHLTDQFAIVHAHNDYLELAGDLGVPMALLLILLAWGYWGKCARRMVRRTQFWDEEGGTEDRSAEHEALPMDRGQVEKRRLLALGALAGGAAFLFQSWVEFNWQIPANQFYFMVLLVLMKV